MIPSRLGIHAASLGRTGGGQWARHGGVTLLGLSRSLHVTSGTPCPTRSRLGRDSRLILSCHSRPLALPSPNLAPARYNSSSSPTSAEPASPTIVTSPSTSQEPTTPTPAQPRRSLLARLTSSVSLANEKSPTAEESSSSSVKKLLLLAKPESRQLGIAVGLVSYGQPISAHQRHMQRSSQLVVSSSVSMLIPLTVGKLIDFFSNDQVSAELDGSVAEPALKPQRRPSGA